MRLSLSRTWAIFLAVTTGTFMVNLDGSIVNVGLPVISHDLHVPLPQLPWVVDVYLLVIAATLPLMGRLADRQGRKGVFLFGLSLFLLGSLLCALAPDYALLVVARGLQGLGGAVIQSNVMAIVSLTFPQSMRGRAIGAIASVVAVGTLLGPVLGGFLIGLWGWRTIFWVNLPVGALGLVASRALLPVFPRSSPEQPLDLPGAGFFALTVWLLLIGLIRIGAHQADLITAACLLGSAASAVFLTAWEKRHAAPLLHPALLLRPPVYRGLLAGFLYWMLVMFPGYLLPLFLKWVWNLPLWAIGLMMTPQAVVMLAFAPLGGAMTDRRGPYRPAMLGMLAFGLSDLAALFLSGRESIPLLILSLFLTGVGAGLFAAPNNTQILSHVPQEATGVMGGLIATERNLGRIFGVTAASLTLTLFTALPRSHQTIPDLPGFLLGFHSAFLVGILLAATGLSLSRRMAAPALHSPSA